MIRRTRPGASAALSLASWFPATLVAIAVGCGPAPLLDAGIDATTPDPDAGTLEAGALDAGARDAGTVDAGAPDAGAPDAGAPDAGADAGPDAPSPDAGGDAGERACVQWHEFGDGLSAAHGRLDGYLRHVVFTHDPSCPSDDNHIRLQVESLGAIYDVSINVDAPGNLDRRLALTERNAPLVGGAWSEGWNVVGTDLSYSADLGVSSDDMTPHTLAELEAVFLDEIHPGFPISVYGVGFSDGTGLHKVHFNSREPDGAVVTFPRANPRYYLLRFDNQFF